MTRATSTDLQRPKYHFTPPTGWMNDPNGLIFWNGQFHLFYQHNPKAATWDAGLCWGHATSSNLIDWQDQEVALQPTPGGADDFGCWSGCAVVHDQQLVLVYTGTRDFNWQTHESKPCVMLAFSNDGIHFQKLETPVLEAPQGLSGWRDPIVWQEGDKYLLSIGAGIKGAGGIVMLYESYDLRHWQELEPLIVGNLEANPIFLGQIWECPQLLQFESRALLLFSVWHERQGLYSVALTGHYHQQKFTADTSQILDYGGSLFAPQTLEHSGRKIMFGWLTEHRTTEAQLAAGWSGVMALPRELSIQNGRFEQRPIVELEALRSQKFEWRNLELQDEIKLFQGDTLEIRARFVLKDSTKIGFKLRAAPDNHEYTLVFVDAQTQELVIDTSHSSLDGSPTSERRMKLEFADLELRIFLDASVIEVFVQGQAMATRIYPTQSNALEIYAFCEGGQGQLESLEIWELSSICL